ncbi:hypothetical protein [Chitinolyticbacter meiyuanensis]|uniref:hypothetical protein n=1 Tax=Chitinolyticbacter meiyuanensis TaxID=682798 RepID=UPI0011E5F915|nr:hypothetical protein [Chitinolyticbacter meiyuanensis]
MSPTLLPLLLNAMRDLSHAVDLAAAGEPDAQTRSFIDKHLRHAQSKLDQARLEPPATASGAREVTLVLQVPAGQPLPRVQLGAEVLGATVCGGMIGDAIEQVEQLTDELDRRPPARRVA